MGNDHTGIGQTRQTETYVAGLQGQRPVIPADFKTLEESAAHTMTAEAYAYVAGGAGLEHTMDANRAAFDRWRIKPAMLKGAAKRDLSVDLLGRRLPSPLLLCPIGVQDLAHESGDLGSSQAAARIGAPMIFSNQASVSMEDCAAAMGDAPRWFQLYWGKSDDLAKSFIQRAENCGCEAIVITLDTTSLGWRPRDLNLGSLPFLHGMGMAQYTTDPVFRDMLSEPPEDNVLAAAMQFLQVFSEPALDWDTVKKALDWTDLPVLLKGIQDPADARIAVDEGFAGVICSNHGGRQVDGAIGSLDALPGIVDAVDGRGAVLFDSGVRTGADMFKALALGADAVCLGRPYVYGLALGGADGAEAVIKNILAELDLTMGLSGCGSIAEITQDRLKAGD